MCSAASDLLAAGGVGLLVMAEGVPGAGFASNRLAEALEDLQFTLGIGPRVDARAPRSTTNGRRGADVWLRR